MLPYRRKSLPLAFIYNNIELFFEFLNRPEARPRPGRVYVPNRQYSKGDRALLSLGDPKLVFVSAPVPHADDLRQRLGYAGTRYVAPVNPSPWLSLDILQEPPLLQALVDYAGSDRTLQLVPYATTPQFWQLVHRLRSEYHLNLILPESPAEANQWLRNYIDTKAGFRALAGRILPNADQLLAEGVACRTLEEAADVARWFGARGKACLVKPDGGESGIGQHVFDPAQAQQTDHLLNELRLDPYLEDDELIVEEYIASGRHLSPSLEVYVPPAGQGDPQITYLSNQLFLGVSDFYGLVVSREDLQAPWYPPLAEAGLRLARALQTMGYAGHYDLDTIVDDADHIYLLELNSRRTAGTHVHEFAQHHFGPDYLQKVALLSVNKMKTKGITRFEDLQRLVADLQYPIAGQARGMIFAVTSILAASEFGCIIVGADTQEALRVHDQIAERLGAPHPEQI